MTVEPTTRHRRLFDNYGVAVNAVAVFPDGRRMATKSQDGMIRLWDWKNGVVLNEMKWKASINEPGCLAISRDGRMIASGEDGGFVMAWDGDTGKPLLQAFKGHNAKVASLDFSPDCATLVTASTVSSSDGVKLCNTQTWQPAQGKPITTKLAVSVRYSPSGEFLAIATYRPSVEIWNPSTGELIATHLIPPSPSPNYWFSPLQWTPDGTCVLTSGVGQELSTIAVWDSPSWTLPGGPWRGHTGSISAIAVNPSGTLVASAADGCYPTPSSDSTVRLWRLSDGENIAIFQHSDIPTCVTFSLDGKYILSGGKDKKIAEWAVPADALPEDDRHVCLRYFQVLISYLTSLCYQSRGSDIKDRGSGTEGRGSDKKSQGSDAKGQNSDTKGQGSGTKGSDTKRQHSDPKVGFHS
jgi:WD40 repeat protein